MELLVVSILMVGVVTATAQFWTNYSLSTIDLTSRSSTAQELRFIVEYLSEDFGSAVGATPVSDDQLLICQDGGQNPNGVADWTPPDILIEYYIEDGKLRRYNQFDNTDIAVAKNVVSFAAENTTPSLLEIAVEVQAYDLSRSITFFWAKP